MKNEVGEIRQKTLWYVEYKAYGKHGYMGQIEAKDGKEAIEYVKSKVIGANSFHVWRDDD